MNAKQKNHRSNFLTTFPVSSLKEQLIVAIISGLVVFLILLMFQPYGTYTFHMRYKALFLAGYGVIFFAGYSLYYTCLMLFFKKWFLPTGWNLLKEIITFIPVLFLIPIAAILYHHNIIGGYTIRLIDVIYFFYISLSVGIIPFSVHFYRKWMKSKLITIQSSDDETHCSITFESTNKKEKSITITSDFLMYIKSEGNYIEVFERNKVKPYQLRNSLNYVESQLTDKNFIRIHRSYIVNTKMIKDLVIVGTSYQLKLKDSEAKLPVSRSKIKEVREIIATNN